MDPLSDALSAIWGMGVNALLLTVPIALVTLFLVFVFNVVQKRTKMKWIGAAVITLFVTFTVFFFLIHAWNIWNGAGQTDTSQIPDDVLVQPAFQDSAPDVLGLLFRGMVQSIIAGVIISILLLPFAFLGVSLFDVLRKKFQGFWLRFFVICFIGSLFLILLLAAFPWIPVSLVYLVFFGI